MTELWDFIKDNPATILFLLFIAFCISRGGKGGKDEGSSSGSTTTQTNNKDS